MNAREHNEEEYLDDEYTEDDVENYLVEDSEEEDDEDWGWKEESDSLDEEDEEEEYIYVDEDGNELADYDDDEYEIEYEEEEEEEEDEDYFLDSEHPLESDLSDFSVDNEQPTVNMETSAHSVHESLSTRADSEYDEDNVDEWEEEQEEEKEEKEKVDYKKKLGEIKEKINIEPIVNSYDNNVSSLVSFLAKIPIVGKVFASVGESKVATRAFPFTFIFLIVGVLVAISFFTAPSKTSVVELPDMGELTVVSKEYNVDTDSMTVSIENTGDVVMSTPLTLSLYSYSPNLNPLSLASFEELGQCAIEDVVVDMGEEKEFILPCSFNKGKTAEDVKFRTVVSLKDVEDNDK